MTFEFFATILIGIYIVVDAIYLASETDGETRYCMIAKYAGAAMSGAFLVLESHDGLSLLFGGTLALFMWPETYFRLLSYLQTNNPKIHRWLLCRVKNTSRRRIDHEAHN